MELGERFCRLDLDLVLLPTVSFEYDINIHEVLWLWSSRSIQQNDHILSNQFLKFMLAPHASPFNM